MSSSSHEHPIPSGSDGGYQNPVFVTTHWSIVLSAQDKDAPGSTAALEALCRTYWYPLYAFVRRQGRNSHDAQDLTQGFFARLLAKDYLKLADSEKGKFRSFLLVSLKRYLAGEWDREHAQKRGGFAPVFSIDEEAAELRFAGELSHRLQPDVLFDRQWAMTLIERVMARLQEEYLLSGRAKLFECLRNCLVKDESAQPYAEIAAQLHLTEAAIKMAVHRLRARYREILRAEIADTVAGPAEIDEEIRHLFSTFST
jgi:RNA polymerase sigma-70 factor (ECF subfamily)